MLDCGCIIIVHHVVVYTLPECVVVSKSPKLSVYDGGEITSIIVGVCDNRIEIQVPNVLVVVQPMGRQ